MDVYVDMEELDHLRAEVADQSVLASPSQRGVHGVMMTGARGGGTLVAATFGWFAPLGAFWFVATSLADAHFGSALVAGFAALAATALLGHVAGAQVSRRIERAAHRRLLRDVARAPALPAAAGASTSVGLPSAAPRRAGRAVGTRIPL